MKKEITLKSFIRSNKVRRENLAKKAGMTVVDYHKHLQLITSGKRVGESKKSLEEAIKIEVEKKEVKIAGEGINVTLPTIHNVILLDGSGSMDGTKFYNSWKGIKEELKYMMKDKSINWTSTIHKFSAQAYSSKEPHFLTKIFDDNVSVGVAEGGTPLYNTIVKVIPRILTKVSLEDKVLIKIYTDGRDTEGGLTACRNFLKKLPKNVTFTFVGTKCDVEKIVKVLKIDESNTLVIDNTEKGFEKAFETSLLATKEYTEKVVKGEDVTTGFYLKFN